MDLPASSLHGVDERTPSPALWTRRGFVAALAAVVLAGLAGLLGVRSDTTSAQVGEWRLTLEHAELARAGFDVPWQVTVTHDGGFDGPLTLAVTGDYFDIFETQGFMPEPTEMTRDGDTLYLTFAAPPRGDTFVVAYDAYIQPAAQRGADGTLSVLDAGVAVASLDFETRLLP